MTLKDPPQNNARKLLSYRHTHLPLGLYVLHELEQDFPITLSELVTSAELVTGVCREYYTFSRFFLDNYNADCTTCNSSKLACAHIIPIEAKEDFDCHTAIYSSERACYNTSLEAAKSGYVRAAGGPFLLNSEESWVGFEAVAPTTKEWETMQDDLAKEEVRKTAMGPVEHGAWMEILLSNEGQ
jgi:hypothetical protein